MSMCMQSVTSSLSVTDNQCSQIKSKLFGPYKKLFSPSQCWATYTLPIASTAMQWLWCDGGVLHLKSPDMEFLSQWARLLLHFHWAYQTDCGPHLHCWIVSGVKSAKYSNTFVPTLVSNGFISSPWTAEIPLTKIFFSGNKCDFILSCTIALFYIVNFNVFSFFFIRDISVLTPLVILQPCS